MHLRAPSHLTRVIVRSSGAPGLTHLKSADLVLYNAIGDEEKVNFAMRDVDCAVLILPSASNNQKVIEN